MTHEIPGADVITRFSALPARVLRENSAMGGFTLSQYFVYYWMTKAQQLFFFFFLNAGKNLPFFPPNSLCILIYESMCPVPTDGMSDALTPDATRALAQQTRPGVS